MTRRTTRALAAATTAAVVGLALLAGCSGDSEDSGDAQRSRSAAPTEATASPTTTDEKGLQRPALARDADELAERLVAAERTARTQSTTSEAQQQAAFDAQVLYRQLARRDAWLRPVLRAVPARLRSTVRANVTARHEFRDMHVRLSGNLPGWDVIDPAPADDLLRYYKAAEKRYDVPWEALAGINLVETSMGRISGTSVAGAQGPMQFIPETWADYGEGEVTDPEDAIMAAGRYLASRGGRGDIDRALFAYNNDVRYVRGVKAYASVMAADERAYRVFYGWQVIYLSDQGDIWLPVGYDESEPIPVTSYLEEFPDRQLSTSTR